MANASSATVQVKPEKPHPDFPLFPHATKRWAKKVKGKLHYFGPWRDPDGALAEWYRVREDLLQGLPYPELRPDAYAVADICDQFLKHRMEKVKAGKLRQRTWDEYKAASELMFKAFGKELPADNLKPKHFERLRTIVSEGVRPKTIHNRITRIMAIVNFSNKNGFTDRPILTGAYFEKPSASELRIDQAKQDHQGVLMLEAKQIKDVLAEARPITKAMILLAVNVGVGNEDIGRLEFRHLDLKNGWLDFPRPKTGVKRRAKLWTETVEALREVIELRQEPTNADLAKYVFLTRYGMTWFKEGRANPISREFRNLLDKTGHHVNGIGFYTLRRVFETIAGEAKDQPAVDLSMGHQSAEVAAIYRQRIGDKRLETVATHVRKWLFGKRVAK